MPQLPVGVRRVLTIARSEILYLMYYLHVTAMLLVVAANKICARTSYFNCIDRLK